MINTITKTTNIPNYLNYTVSYADDVPIIVRLSKSDLNTMVAQSDAFDFFRTPLMSSR